MSEIEKLYENANADKDCKLYANIRMCPYKTRECTDCKYYVYPDFTAEKQLELIKWLVQEKRREITISFEFLGNDFHFSTDILAGSFEKTFEEAFAKLVNHLLQDLTDTEKAEIKRILE